jgi:hypothetical protein
MPRLITQTDKARFGEALATQGWLTVDDLVRHCEREGLFSKEFLEHATATAKKALVRKMARAQKDGRGWTQWASIKTKTPDGKEIRVYKQETLFDLEDYRQVIGYHATLAQHHRQVAQGYAARARERFGKQLKFPFEEEPAEAPAVLPYAKPFLQKSRGGPRRSPPGAA